MVWQIDENIGIIRKMQLRFKKLHPDGKMPTQAYKGDAFDLYASEPRYLSPWSRVLVPTGIAMEIPLGFRGRIVPRSGLSIKNGILIGGGLIDPLYRGDVGVILFNLSNTEFEVKTGMKIAQFIIEPAPEIEWIESIELSPSARDTDGFGSTGV